EDDPEWGRVPSESRVPARSSLAAAAEPVDVPARSPEVEDDNEIFVPPFTGSRVVKGLAIDDIAGYVNETALFRNQWGYRPEGGPEWGRVPSESRVPARSSLAAAAEPVDVPARSPEVEDDNEIFVPPFTGSRVVKGLAIDDIAGYVNETALFRNQWGYRPEGG